MEFTDAQIARLVLGYLKSERCKSCYQEFLKCPKHLEEEHHARNKYLITRVSGLGLVDFLQEYAQIYTIVQATLEATNFYRENDARASLVDQLKYLLSKIHSSRSSTPSSRYEYESADETVIGNHSDVETTPAHTLPGNVCYGRDASLSPKTTKRKSSIKHRLSGEKESDTLEVLAKTLIENKELHEKLAQTINIVRNTPENHQKKCLDESINVEVSAELDATIKTVVKKTEEDPIFDQILDEIIGSATVNDDVQRPSETENDSGTKRLISQSVGQSVEEQNNEAVQSIIVASNNKESKPNSNEVIVFDGTFDSYLKTSSQCNMPNTQNPVYLNPGSVLVIPNQSNVLSYDSNKHFYVMNNPPVVNVNIPQIKSENIINEQDIMAMPTVIVNDDKQLKFPQGGPIHLVQPQAIYPQKNEPVKIVPKTTKKDELHENLQEYITLYSATGSATQPEHVQQTNTRSLKPVTTKSSITPLKCNVPSTSNDQNENVELNSKDKLHQKSTKDVQTPKQEKILKGTPKSSSSHIRNLDFSTPPKVTSTGKKKPAKSQPSQKGHASKHLFKKETPSDDSTIKTENIRKKSLGSWDADLRALASNGIKSATPKRKRKSPIKVKKKMKKTESKLNTTDHEAMLLEAALQTPEKNADKSLKDCKEIEEENKTSRTSIVKVSTNKNDAKHVNKKCRKLSNETDDHGNKTVWSPSKLKANKRSVVRTETVEIKSEPSTSGIQKENDVEKLITPEMKKDNIKNPIKISRNLIPLLETPIKTDGVPKTPGSFTPATGFTPFTKVIEDQLIGVDINSLPTPSLLPLTPSFPPFTPCGGNIISPYSNRPTDYSGSSSYYQPSDTEQNKSIEQLMDEYQKEGTIKKEIKIISDIVIESQKLNANPVRNKPSIQDHLKEFNKTIIGKKNLNLVKRNYQESSSSSGSEEESSSDEHESQNNWLESQDNDTVIFKSNNLESQVKRSYPLRNRSTTVPTKSKDSDKTLEINKIINTIEIKNTLEKKPDLKKINLKEKVLQEMKEKRERIVSKIKSTEKLETETVKLKKGRSIAKQSQPKNSVTKKDDIKTTRKNRRKSDSPKKAIDRKTKTPDSRAIDIGLHLSSDDDVIDVESPIKNKSAISNTLPDIKQITKTETQATQSDCEAERLIEGLGQRGIHLTYNKTSKSVNPLVGSLEKSKLAETVPVEMKNENDNNTTNAVTKQELLPNISKDPKMYKDNQHIKNANEKIEETKVKTKERIHTARTDEHWHTVLFEKENEKIVCNNEKVTNKKFQVVNFLKKFDASVYFDYQDINLPVKIRCTDFDTLLDIEPKVNVLIPKRRHRVAAVVKIPERRRIERGSVDEKSTKIQKKSESNSILEKSSEIKKTSESNTIKKESKEKDATNKIEPEVDVIKDPAEDELMNFAIICPPQEENSESSNSSPKLSKKRKARSIEDETHMEKKSKSINQDVLLKKINVDMFLNKVHGQN